MKVRELIARLENCDPDMKVKSEGCDCIVENSKVVLGSGYIWDEDNKTHLRDGNGELVRETYVLLCGAANWNKNRGTGK